MSENSIDVAIIGGGPAGLAAGTQLKRAGVARVVIFEREVQAGGIPRHCGHPPFGMREFQRVYTGPQYARKLVARALEAGVDIRTLTTVVEALPGGKLLITDKGGMREICARRVIYATGVRETPRSARVISGSRPLGVINTGALQSMVFLKHRRPFKRPIIVGTELVSFSAIMTCRHMCISPVAMIDHSSKVRARWPVGWFAPLVRLPLYLKTQLVEIQGDKQVNSVVIEDEKGNRRSIDCDGVLLTGQFTPESTLARCGHIDIDTGSFGTNGPVVDQYGRCSDPAYFAAGNLLRPVETAGWSWNEGRMTGQRVARDLTGNLPAVEQTINLKSADRRLKYVMPQRIVLPLDEDGEKNLQLRVTEIVKGRLEALNEAGQVIYSKSINIGPDRRILVPVAQLLKGFAGGHITFRCQS